MSQQIRAREQTQEQEPAPAGPWAKPENSEAANGNPRTAAGPLVWGV
jgi:hypothetical protein